MTNKFEIYVRRDRQSYTGDMSLIERNDEGDVIEARSMRNIPILTGLKNKFEKKFDWVRGQGGIPEGEYWLWIEPRYIKQIGQLDPRGGEIGQAYHLSSDLKDHTVIKQAGTGRTRTAIMIHADNDFPGSAGCIVFPNNPAGRSHFKSFIKWCEFAYQRGIKHIPVKVFRGD